MRQPLTAGIVAGVLAVAGGRPPAMGAEEIPVGPRIAATANGQTIAAIDESRRAIFAFDASRPDARRMLVGPAAAEAVAFVAVGYVTGDVLAAVCRTGDDWSLCTYRTDPAGAVDAAKPLQRVAIGTASGDSERVDLAVGHARGWLAVTGLPAPLPPVLRAAAAGVRVGPLTDRGCPARAAALTPIAAAVSPADELVLVLRAVPAGDARPAGGDEIAFFDLAGRELLRLPAGVPGIRGLDFGRGDNALWAVAAGPAGRSGLWRLDAALVEGRQVIRPALVAPLDSPRDLVACSPRAIVVVHGDSVGRVAVLDPTKLAARETPGGAP
jgi:hypothetical protein